MLMICFVCGLLLSVVVLFNSVACWLLLSGLFLLFAYGLVVFACSLAFGLLFGGDLIGFAFVSCATVCTCGLIIVVTFGCVGLMLFAYCIVVYEL